MTGPHRETVLQKTPLARKKPSDKKDVFEHFFLVSRFLFGGGGGQTVSFWPVGWSNRFFLAAGVVEPFLFVAPEAVPLVKPFLFGAGLVEPLLFGVGGGRTVSIWLPLGRASGSAATSVVEPFLFAAPEAVPLVEPFLFARRPWAVGAGTFPSQLRAGCHRVAMNRVVWPGCGRWASSSKANRAVGL